MHPNAPIPYVAKHLSSRDLILWVDVETTGADPATALPLEIAAAITNIKGDIVSEIRHRRWIYPRSWRGMLEAETAMHAGWIEECLSDTVRWPCVPQLDMDLFNLWVDAHVTAELEPKRALRLPLGGKNVAYDRSVLLRVAPVFSGSLLSYRNVDTKILDVAGLPEVIQTPGFPPIGPAHRAKADVLTAITHYIRARQVIAEAKAR